MQLQRHSSSLIFKIIINLILKDEFIVLFALWNLKISLMLMHQYICIYECDKILHRVYDKCIHSLVQQEQLRCSSFYFWNIYEEDHDICMTRGIESLHCTATKPKYVIGVTETRELMLHTIFETSEFAEHVRVHYYISTKVSQIHTKVSLCAFLRKKTL
jgi:hypothetical protein